MYVHSKLINVHLRFVHVTLYKFYFQRMKKNKVLHCNDFVRHLEKLDIETKWYDYWQFNQQYLEMMYGNYVHCVTSNIYLNL